ncbi:MAG: hypothetical protein ACRC9V_06130 [Aeromonas sp.]
MEERKTNNIHHCPACGSELRTGTDDRSFECSGCEYTEQERSA